MIVIFKFHLLLRKPKLEVGLEKDQQPDMLFVHNKLRRMYLKLGADI